MATDSGDDTLGLGDFALLFGVVFLYICLFVVVFFLFMTFSDVFTSLVSSFIWFHRGKWRIDDGKNVYFFYCYCGECK